MFFCFFFYIGTSPPSSPVSSVWQSLSQKPYKYLELILKICFLLTSMGLDWHLELLSCLAKILNRTQVFLAYAYSWHEQELSWPPAFHYCPIAVINALPLSAERSDGEGRVLDFSGKVVTFHRALWVSKLSSHFWNCLKAHIGSGTSRSLYFIHVVKLICLIRWEVYFKGTQNTVHANQFGNQGISLQIRTSRCQSG